MSQLGLAHLQAKFKQQRSAVYDLAVSFSAPTS